MKMFHVFAILCAFVIASPASAEQSVTTQEPIKIGDINSYSLDPKSVSAYENGVKMAVEEINTNGGVLGRPFEYLLRDDKGDPAEAIRVTEELVFRDKVSLLAGTWYNATAAAVSTYANKNKIPFLATFSPGDKIIGEHKTLYAFSLWPTTRTETMALVGEAAKTELKNWAIIVPTFDDGLLAQSVFKEGLKSLQPDTQFVYEHRYEAEKLNAASLLPVLMRNNPDGILMIGLPSDISNFIREGNARGWLKNKKVFTLWNGYPDVRETIGNITPEGWVVTGYPVEAITAPEHKAFVDAYRKKYKNYPTYGALFGYVGYKMIAEAIDKAGSLDADKIIKILPGLELKNTPLGDVYIDATTHQSSIGAYVGTIAHKDGSAYMKDWYAVPPAEVKQ